MSHKFFETRASFLFKLFTSILSPYIKDAVAAVEVVKEEVKTVAKKATTKAKKAVVEVEAAVKKAKTPRKPKA